MVLDAKALPSPRVPLTPWSLACQFLSPRMVAPAGMLLSRTAWNAERWDLVCWSVTVGLLIPALWSPSTPGSCDTPSGDRALGAGLVFPQSFSTACWHFMLGAAVETSLRIGIVSVLFASVFAAPSIVPGTK